MKILITGATGFVGRQVVGVLAQNKNVQLRVIVREKKEKLLPQKIDFESIYKTANIFTESSEWLKKVCTDIDIFIHLAWYAEPGLYLSSEKNLECIQGTLNLARAAKQASIRRFVGIGTCFEYDLDHGILSVNTPLKPGSLYAASKASTYMILSKYFALSSIEFAWCRLFYLYGEGEDDRRLVPYLRKQLTNGQEALLSSGEQIRDFLNVKIAARMIADVTLSSANGPVNICSGKGITVRQLAENIAKEYNRLDLLKFGARPDNEIDPSKVIGVRNF